MNKILTQVAAQQLYHDYQRQGFVVLRQVFSAEEMNRVREAFDQAFADPAVIAEDSLRKQTRRSLLTGTVMDRLDPIIDLSPVLKQLSKDRRILQATEAVLGEPALLFKDKAIMKPSGAYGYGIHQDYTNWQELPVPPACTLSVLVAIDAATAENGALQVYPGLHQQHLRPPEKPSDIFNPSAGLVEPELLGHVQPVMTEVEPGDLVLFSSLAPHCSGPNRSARARRSLFLSYAAARFGDVYSLYYANFYGYLQQDRERTRDPQHSSSESGR